ncbi:hypothetical protein LXL04_028452 [Taraxacum kok-saghyz]
MATESPIRIIEANRKWNDINMGIEEMGLGLNSQRFHNPTPNRSGSAPPSIEGSFAAIENLMFRQHFARDVPNVPESEEQLRADPSYFAYYWAHVNLNPRLPPPLVSDENRNHFRNVRNTGNSNKRLTSFDDSFSGSLQLDHSSLSTHKEESDDEISPKEEDLPFIPEPKEEKENQKDSNNPTTTTVSSSETDVSTLRNRIASLNIPNIPKIESERNQEDSSTYQQQRNMLHIHGTHPQIVSLPQTSYVMNQNYMSEVRSTGFTPPYAPDPAYMTSHIYPNVIPAGYFHGYGFNPSPISPYATGYLNLPNSPLATPFCGQSQTPGVNFSYFNSFYGHETKLQSLGVMGNVGFDSRRVGTTSSYYSDFLQFTNSPFGSPGMPGSPVGGGGYSGRRWKGNFGNQVVDDSKTYSFLEELKSGKGRRFELSDIFGSIVDFSVDQHGSRFIQQKLEVCSNAEKESVFKEVLPHTSKLMTDVFGNYVIQKFFEYGSGEQRRELGNQLQGQILSLSLQMYGCRVIQKALDAIDLEQKTKLIGELDGHVLKCVRDQNGNHVIQKCIESIPTDKIGFVISSFRGEVAALSKHPYGCRVIQRVLEHSTDKLHSQFIVDEILDSVYDLAQDQYGNYVTQYVLEGGKPEERSRIVQKLGGHIVQLSQHKFASNVIEKCLEYGDSGTREIMIEEIIGNGDGNDNLLVMVKDQFANYVVQKVLQTCSGTQREVLLGRIKIHLNSLKKYTYGKHIVARFEQLYGEEIEASGS